MSLDGGGGGNGILMGCFSPQKKNTINVHDFISFIIFVQSFSDTKDKTSTDVLLYNIKLVTSLNLNIQFMNDTVMFM